jgi:UPF0042 nucleotide-binding protein
MRIVMVIGFSGAGKSVALKTFADLGFEAIDNLPIPTIPLVVKGLASARTRLALCSDVRSRDFSADQFLAVHEALRREYPDAVVELVFLTCDEQVLLRRFTETRHRHPLALDRPIEDGIRLEAQLLSRVRDQADVILDTSEFGPHDLKRVLSDRYSDGQPTLKVNLVSFSFRRGLPREADMVIDARFLRNPHYDEVLRPQTGQSAEVGSYIRQDPDFELFFDQLTRQIDFLLPRYAREGKSYFTLAIGCTGGKHRSVHLVESLAEYLRDRKIHCFVRHRELEG